MRRFSFLFLAVPMSLGAADTFPVHLEVDLAKTGSKWRPVWRFFGADEPNYATMTHGKKLLGELGELAPRQIYFRAHNLLTSGDGTPALKWGSTGVYSETPGGEANYSWTILDQIFDAYARAQVRPYVEIGFMPEALSTRPQPYQHHWTPTARYEEIYTGWAFPPKDYKKWADLIYAWARHASERYGAAEVESWYWEVWNEPNIGYWRGTPEEFRKLHDYGIDAVRRAIPKAKVGGPDTAGHGGRFMRAFLEHSLRETNYATGKVGTPLDFVSFHAKGAPVFTNGHVRMGIAAQLRTVDEGFGIIGSYPELRRTPIVIGESDPEGCAACQGPSLGYRNGTMYSSYTAESFARIQELADSHEVNLEGVLTWAFEFEGHPFFAGFRSLASQGIDHPVLNLFRLFSMMGGTRVRVQSDAALPLTQILLRGVRGQPDVNGVAALESGKLSLLLWHYHDEDLPGPEAAIEIDLKGLPRTEGEVVVEQFRIDQRLGNAFALWQEMGSPRNPSPEQYAALEKRGRDLLASKTTLGARAGSLKLRIDLPRQAVSLVRFRFE